MEADFFSDLYQAAFEQGEDAAEQLDKPLNRDRILYLFLDCIDDRLDEYIAYYEAQYGVIYGPEEVEFASTNTENAIVQYWNLGFNSKIDTSAP